MPTLSGLPGGFFASSEEGAASLSLPFSASFAGVSLGTGGTSGLSACDGILIAGERCVVTERSVPAVRTEAIEAEEDGRFSLLVEATEAGLLTDAIGTVGLTPFLSAGGESGDFSD